MATMWIWTGTPDHDRVRIKARIQGTSARLALSKSEPLQFPEYYGPVTPNSNGICDFEITGLEPDTEYWSYVEDTGTPDPTWKGRFKTLSGAPGEQVSFTFSAWSCAGNNTLNPGALPYVSNHPVLDTITDRKPHFNIQMGDIHYANISTSGEAAYRTAYDGLLNRLDTPRMSRHLAQVPQEYIWDDHDYGPNDSDKDTPGRMAVANVFREYVPHRPLPESGAIYRSWQTGRVLHIMTDTRYHRDPNGTPNGPNKTMLGPAQKQWLSDVLANSTAEYLIWHCPSQWMTDGEDNWGNFSYDRDQILSILEAPNGDSSKDWTHRMFMTTGDAHMIVMDDGTGNRWGNFPVFYCASVDSNGGNLQLERFIVDNKYVPTSPGRKRYGVFDVEDNGDHFRFHARLYIGKWLKYEYEWTHELTSTPVTERPFQAAEVEAIAEVEWSKGEYFGGGSGSDGIQPITSFRIDREIATDLPDQMRTSQGLSAAEADFIVAAPSGETLGAWSPWRNPLKYHYAPTRLTVVTDGDEHVRFRGTTASAQSNSDGVELSVSALDDMSALNEVVEIPAFAGVMGGQFNPGLSAEWIVEHVLMSAGRGALWDPHPDAVTYASLAGSSMANVGNWLRQYPQTGQPPTFTPTWDLPYSVMSSGGGRTVDGAQDGPETSTGFTVGAIIGDSPTTTTGYLNTVVGMDHPSGYARYLFVRFHSTNNNGDYVQVRITDLSNNLINEVSIQVELGPTWVSLQPSGSSYVVRVRQPGEADKTATVSNDLPVTGTQKISSFFFSSLNGAGLGLQMIPRGNIPTEELPVWDRDRATIAAPQLDLKAIPAVEPQTGKDILTQLADAELGAFWFDEEGDAVIQNRAELRGYNKQAVPVYSETSLVDPGTWSTSIDQVYSQVEVPVSLPSFEANPDQFITLWQAKEVVRIDGHQTLDIIVTLDTPGGGIATTFWAGDFPDVSWFHLYRSSNGSGPRITASASDNNGGRVYSVGPNKVRIVWRNPYPFTVYMVNSDGEPEMNVRGRWAITANDPVFVVEQSGAKGATLQLNENPWRQDLTDGRVLARWLADEVKAPRPYLEDLKVTYDPRIKLGSVIRLRDPDRYGVDFRCLVRAVTEDVSADGITMSISAQPLRILLAEFDANWTAMTLGDVDDHYSGQTLGDLDNNPLSGGTANA